MDILDMSKEEERTGKKEHVVFLVVQKPHSQIRKANPNTQDVEKDEKVLFAIFKKTVYLDGHTNIRIITA